jgi:hypothetical protein
MSVEKSSENEELNTSEIKIELESQEPIYTTKNEDHVPITVPITEPGNVYLNCSSMESFYVMNELAIGYYAGDMQKCYLRFDKQYNKLLDVIYDAKKGGRIEINPRYEDHRDELWLIEPKLGLKIYEQMAKTRSDGKGTILKITGDSKTKLISKIECQAINTVNL